MRFVLIALLSLHLNCYGSMMWDSYQWYQFDWGEREKHFVKTLEHIEKKGNADSTNRILLLILSIDGEVLLDFIGEKIKFCESGDEELKQHIPVYQRIVQQIKEIMRFMQDVYG